MALATQVTASTGIAVPASIDATGSSDASAALNAFIKVTPDGSTIVFKAGGTYRLDHGLQLTNRHHLVFEGNGATLRANGPAATQASPFRLNSGNSGIVIRYFTIIGNNPNTTTLYTAGSEDQMGVLIYGSTNIEIAHNTISHTWGDGVYVGPNVNTHASSNGIWVHDNTFSYIGRMGIAVVDGSNITVERNSFDKVGLHVFDIEPDTAWEVTAFATFRNNTVGSYGLSDKYTGYFFAADGAVGSTIHDVTVTGNTVTGGSLLTIVHLARRQNVVFTNNTSTVRATGPVLRFAHVDGLTVTGNVQPLTSGGLARITDSTGVTYP
jgi:parallel beta-helix repeat protein